MARFVDAIDLPVSIEEAFDYLADFSRTRDWDPGVRGARRLTQGGIGLGSRFRVEVSFFGRRSALDYEIVSYDRPSRLVLEGGDDRLRSIDEITFTARPDGTRVTYEARLELGSGLSLLDPALDRVFQRIGRAGANGLRAMTAEDIRSALASDGSVASDVVGEPGMIAATGG